MTKIIDLTGQRFSRLLVIRRGPDKLHVGGSRSVRWLCLCACGKEKLVMRGHLKHGKTTSCGCVRVKKDTPINSLFSGYRRGALSRKLPFELSREQFKELLLGVCHYCGRSPSQTIARKFHCHQDFRYNGVDRKDNTLGYTSDNSVSCCGECNARKSDTPYADFLSWVSLVSRNLGQRDG